MKFLLLISGDETMFNRRHLPRHRPISPEYVAYTEAMTKAGVWSAATA